MIVKSINTSIPSPHWDYWMFLQDKECKLQAQLTSSKTNLHWKIKFSFIKILSAGSMETHVQLCAWMVKFQPELPISATTNLKLGLEFWTSLTYGPKFNVCIGLLFQFIVFLHFLKCHSIFSGLDTAFACFEKI